MNSLHFTFVLLLFFSLSLLSSLSPWFHFFFFFCLFILKVEVTERRQHWLASHMAAKASTAPGQSQEPGASRMSSTCIARMHVLLCCFSQSIEGKLLTKWSRMAYGRQWLYQPQCQFLYFSKCRFEYTFTWLKLICLSLNVNFSLRLLSFSSIPGAISIWPLL